MARPLLAQSLSVAAAQEDFDVLWKSIKEAHGGLRRFVSEAELNQEMAKHRARLSQPTSVIGLAGVLSESIGALRDGHARLEWDSTTTATLNEATLLPLRFAIEGEKLVIALNQSPSDTTLRPGTEIVRINGRAAATLIRDLLPKVSGDGFIETGKRARLARDFAQMFWLHVEPATTYRVSARDGARVMTTDIAGVALRDRRQDNPVNATLTAQMTRLDGPRGNVVLEYVDDGRVALLRVRAFDGQAFLPTLDSAFRAVRDRGTQAMILDLRGNGGGVDQFGAGLVSYFLDKPFRYFDHIRVSTIAPSFATWLPRTFEAMKVGSGRSLGRVPPDECAAPWRG